MTDTTVSCVFDVMYGSAKPVMIRIVRFVLADLNFRQEQYGQNQKIIRSLFPKRNSGALATDVNTTEQCGIKGHHSGNVSSPRYGRKYNGTMRYKNKKIFIQKQNNQSDK